MTDAAKPAPVGRPKRAAKKHGGFAVRFAGERFEVTCDCGLSAVEPWPEASALRAIHDV